MSNELVVIYKKMDNFVRWVFCRIMVIHWNKFFLRIRINWLDLRNSVLTNAGEFELFKVFKVEHIVHSPQKTKMPQDTSLYLTA